MNDPTQLKQRMGELGAQFLQRTERELATLRELLTRLRAGDATACQEIEYLGHRICGTGATLGFAHISEHASQIERLAEGRSTVEPGLLEQLENNLTSLEQVVSEALE